MKVIVAKNYEEMSEKAFGIMREVVVKNPSAILGLATGSTPLGLYKKSKITRKTARATRKSAR